MDTTTLAQLEHRNLIEAIAMVAALTPGNVILRDDGVALIATGLPLRLFNQVLVESDEATEAAIETAVARTHDRGDKFVVNLRGGTDDRFLPLMRRLGLVPVSETSWLPGLALHPLPADVPAKALDHDIRAITDAAGVEDHVVAASVGFEMSESMLRGIVDVALLERPDVTIYVGYASGAPVSTGLGVRTGRTIGVYNISTVPAFRRRGLGAAMTARVAADGARAGCDVAILQATAMGLPVYQRLGYRVVVDYMGYVEA
jgi:GNAT superfamily N-acetyltransferase